MRRWPQYVLLAGSLIALLMVTVNEMQGAGMTLEEARAETLTVESGQLSAMVSLNEGAFKPQLYYAGIPFLEFSDWASEITAAGQTRSLWDTRFRVEASEDASEIVHTRFAGGYELTQVTRLADDHAVIEFLIAPSGDQEIGPVTLQLSHYRWYFAAVEPTDDGATLTYDEEPARAWFRRDPSGPITVASDDEGIHSFTTEYQMTTVPRGQWTLIAREEVWFRPPPQS